MYKTIEEYVEILLEDDTVKFAIDNLLGCSEKGTCEETANAEWDMVKAIIEKYNTLKVLR